MYRRWRTLRGSHLLLLRRRLNLQSFVARSKTSALRENPKACLQVDLVENELLWKSAIAFGVYEEITNPNERSNVLNKMLARCPLLTPVESTIAKDAAAPPVIIYRIRVERITGMAEQ